MKGEDIFKVISDIDDDLLEQCEQGTQKPKIKTWARYIPAAACACILFTGLAITALHNNDVKTNATKNNQSQTENKSAISNSSNYDYEITSTTSVNINNTPATETKTKKVTTTVTSNDLAIHYPMYDSENSDTTVTTISAETPQNSDDTKTALSEDNENNSTTTTMHALGSIPDSILKYSDSTYTCIKSVNKNYVDNYFATITPEENKIYDYKLYTLKNVSKNVAVIAKIHDEEEFSLYLNTNYKPDNLETEINDLNLKEYVSVSDISFNKDYFEEYKGYNTKFDFLYFLKLLNDYGDAPYTNESKKYNNSENRIYINFSDSNLYDGLIWISPDGYLGVNINFYENTFFIGKDLAKEITDYALVK